MGIYSWNVSLVQHVRINQCRTPHCYNRGRDKSYIIISIDGRESIWEDSMLFHDKNTQQITSKRKVKSESEVAQSCPTLCDPMDCSLPGSSVYGLFQAWVLEWVTCPQPLPKGHHGGLYSMSCYWWEDFLWCGDFLWPVVEVNKTKTQSLQKCT